MCVHELDCITLDVRKDVATVFPVDSRASCGVSLLVERSPCKDFRIFIYIYIGARDSQCNQPRLMRVDETSLRSIRRTGIIDFSRKPRRFLRTGSADWDLVLFIRKTCVIFPMLMPGSGVDRLVSTVIYEFTRKEKFVGFSAGMHNILASSCFRFPAQTSIPDFEPCTIIDFTCRICI